MINDVKIKDLKCIRDDRGFLMEMLRCDDSIFEGFGQVYVTTCKRGIAKAWHYHEKQTDHFICISGKALVVLYDMRKDSSTVGEVNEYILESPSSDETKPILLKIPPLVVHGFTALDLPEARIINIPTLPYEYDNPDEYRIPWDSPEVPYSWNDEVKKGG